MVATRSTLDEEAAPVIEQAAPIIESEDTPAVADADGPTEQMATPPLPPLMESTPQPSDYRMTDYMGPPGGIVARSKTFYDHAVSSWEEAMGRENLILQVTRSGGDEEQYAEAQNAQWPIVVTCARMALNSVRQALNLVTWNQDNRHSGVPSRYEELTRTYSSLETQINARPEFFVNSLATSADTTSDTTNRGDITMLRNSAASLLSNLENFKTMAPHFGGKEESGDDIDFRSFFARVKSCFANAKDRALALRANAALSDADRIGFVRRLIERSSVTNAVIRVQRARHDALEDYSVFVKFVYGEFSSAESVLQAIEEFQFFKWTPTSAKGKRLSTIIKEKVTERKALLMTVEEMGETCPDDITAKVYEETSWTKLLNVIKGSMFATGLTSAVDPFFIEWQSDLSADITSLKRSNKLQLTGPDGQVRQLGTSLHVVATAHAIESKIYELGEYGDKLQVAAQNTKLINNKADRSWSQTTQAIPSSNLLAISDQEGTQNVTMCAVAQSERAPMVCFVCGKEGHAYRECNAPENTINFDSAITRASAGPRGMTINLVKDFWASSPRTKSGLIKTITDSRSAFYKSQRNGGATFQRARERLTAIIMRNIHELDNADLLMEVEELWTLESVDAPNTDSPFDERR
mmetsp:Transcript_2113/g.7898  ORF Transcript_2113/g.7898 Transcript_2113/m.7898 type:complete len:638 (-) Transcript_2113:11-1924(-)